MQYYLLFLCSLAISAFAIPFIKKLARATGAVDVPNSPRKIHTSPIPLLGGLAVFLGFALTLIIYLGFMHPEVNGIPLKFFLAILLGGLILMISGYLDDRYNLRPMYACIGPLLASLVIVLSGIGVGITIISNPLHSSPPFTLTHHILLFPVSGIFVFLFILGMIYTTKFLDGMDGLASGISFISGLTLFFLSLTPKIHQNITASLAIIFCGAVLGFLIYNFNPASIFLGESGSTFLGFMLGVLSVLLGGKIATAVLVMGIPILDVAWVIMRRLWFGVSPFQADRKHLHFRLLDIGFSQRQTVLILYFIAAVFGFLAIFLQSVGKLISLIILLCIMVIMALSTVVAYKQKNPHKEIGN